MNEILRRAIDPRICKRAFVVALVVGTILNIINNYEVLLGAPLDDKTLIQIVLTFAVPYLVSTHGQLAGTDRGAR
ncbi:MAG: nitrate/nitrite transporter NrtS [Gammaproteobacteria bacterium]